MKTSIEANYPYRNAYDAQKCGYGYFSAVKGVSHCFCNLEAILCELPVAHFHLPSVMESHHSSSDFDHGNTLTPGLSTIVSGTATMIDSNELNDYSTNTYLRHRDSEDGTADNDPCPLCCEHEPVRFATSFGWRISMASASVPTSCMKNMLQ